MESDAQITPLGSVEAKLQAACVKLRIKSFSTFRPWVKPKQFARLNDICTNNAAHLDARGKHQGGRGRTKAGNQKQIQPKFDPWFPELEALLDARIQLDRRNRLKVSTKQIIEWMNTMVAKELRERNENPTDQAVEEKAIRKKLEKFKASRGWLYGFLKRHGFTRRRATNKRFLSAEDLLGDVLGFVRYLRQIRRESPDDNDTIWGLYNQYTTFNTDSVPIPFASTDKVTIEKFGAKRISIIQAGSKLDYRQATLHLTIRPKGKQPWPALIFRGQTHKTRTETCKRQKEMQKYAKFHVHVLWQSNAWVNEDIITNHWAPAFEKDLSMVGLGGKGVLVLMDNLSAQKTKPFQEVMSSMGVQLVYGPKNGTDIWQPVDHGVGRRYQQLLDGYYVEWTKLPECQDLFKQQKAPAEERRRELLVQWVDRAYRELEKERASKESRGDKSIFEKAFLRTGCLVSANGDNVDNEMAPEGACKAMEESTDNYYRQHCIQTFRQLLACSDGNCNHAEPPPPLPGISAEDEKADSAQVSQLFAELVRSQDERAKLLVKCVKGGLKWAGSSFTEFLSKGVEGLLKFLSEKIPATADAPESLAHDIDLYRINDSTQKLGKRFIGTQWECPGALKARAVDKFHLVLKQDNKTQLQIDQVNLHKSNINPSTDLWPNICASLDDGCLCVGQLWQNRGPPLGVTLHHALSLHSGTPVPCYVLRRHAMPTYDASGNFQQDDSYCDGRFRKKLHSRSEKGLVNLVPSWKPGPHFPTLEYFKRLGGCITDGSSSDDIDLDADESEEEDLEDYVPLASNHTTTAIRNWQPPCEAKNQEATDALLAQRLAGQMEFNPHGESMRNRRPIHRDRQNQRPSRNGTFRGSYTEN